MDWITISTIVSAVATAVATAVIAIFSWMNWKVATKIQNVSERMELLSKNMQKENQQSRITSNKTFWAIVLSNILTDSSTEKLRDRFGFLMELVGIEVMKEQLSFSDDNLKKALYGKTSKVVDKYFENRAK